MLPLIGEDAAAIDMIDLQRLIVERKLKPLQDFCKTNAVRKRIGHTDAFRSAIKLSELLRNEVRPCTWHKCIYIVNLLTTDVM